MQPTIEQCRHQLIHPPLAVEMDGTSYLAFQCVICGWTIGFSLDLKGNVCREVIVPPDFKSTPGWQLCALGEEAGGRA